MYFLVILILIIAFLAYNTGYYMNRINNINGFWVCSEDFNKNAELDNFIIYIGKYDIKTNGFPSYILMIDNENHILINTPISIKIKLNSFSLQKFNINFVDLNSEFLSNKLACTFNGTKLELFKGDTLYGCLYKNNELSQLTNI
jgi:hypothetical protein